jgi:hypothetical protein
MQEQQLALKPDVVSNLRGIERISGDGGEVIWMYNHSYVTQMRDIDGMVAEQAVALQLQAGHLSLILQ